MQVKEWTAEERIAVASNIAQALRDEYIDRVCALERTAELIEALHLVLVQPSSFLNNNRMMIAEWE